MKKIPRKLKRSTRRALWTICCDLLGPPRNSKTSWWWEWNGSVTIRVVHTSGDNMGATGYWTVGPLIPYEYNRSERTLFSTAGQKAFKQAVLSARLRGTDES